MSENIIEISGLTKSYKLYESQSDRVKEVLSFTKKSYHKDFRALDSVSFEVKKGETVGIIGTNGAGKSTLLKIITGVLSPSDGKVKISGKVSALLELGAGFNQEYTGLENIYLNGRMMGYSKKEIEKKLDDIISFADIGEFIHQPVKTYSSGMFARLAFAVAINVEPDILIVDEALSVGDIFFQNKCFKKFDELKKKNVTILFVSHDIGSIRQMCSRVLWLESGKEKIFDKSEKVCDMYMDEKRKSMDYVSQSTFDEKKDELTVIYRKEKVKYPVINHVEDRFNSNKVKVISVFFRDEEGNSTSVMYVDKKYTAHVAAEFYENVSGIIVGFVFENNKGLPLYDINNYINQQETISAQKGQVIEVEYHFTLPRIMNGVYLVGAAVAEGTQSRHTMLTWLHAVRQMEVINQGYNSSYIEIPSRINVYATEKENVSTI